MWLFVFVGFPEEAKEAEAHGTRVNVNKFHHSKHLLV